MTLSGQECLGLRNALGMSVERPAFLAGVTERTAVRFENGAVTAKPGTIKALRKALKVAANQAHLRD